VGFVEARGHRIAVFSEPGPREALPLLLVHGGPGASHQQLWSLARLADERTVVGYDQLDCGASAHPGEPSSWTVEGIAREFMDVARSTCPLGFHVLGHSWGAAIVLKAVELGLSPAPRSVVLSGPLVSTRAWLDDAQPLFDEILQEQRRRHGSVQAAFHAATEEFNARHWCRNAELRTRLLAARDGFSSDVYQAMWGPTEFLVTGSLASLDLRASLPKLGVPALITRGEHDMVGASTAAAWAASCRGAVATFPDAAHLAFAESLASYQSVLREFLRSQEAPD